MASYNLQQQTFVLSMLASLAQGKIQPKDESNLQAYLAQQLADALGSKEMTPLMGDWKLVWGPCVTLDPGASTVASQVVFVATTRANPIAPPTVVVAVAGTNGASTLDVDEDMHLVPAPWPLDSTAPTANVTSGTGIGLNTILGMYDHAAKQTLAEALSAFAKNHLEKATLIFSGHSLGGALAPALALNLAPRVGTWAHIYVMPTAGPTVADSAFQSAFTKQFPSVDGPSFPWNTNIVNTLDVVPMAWANLDGMKTVYDIKGSALGVDALVAHLKKNAAAFSGFDELPSSPFNGTFQTSSTLKPMSYWTTEALYQHINGYYVGFQVDNLPPQYLPADPFDPTTPPAQMAATMCTRASNVLPAYAGLCGSTDASAKRVVVDAASEKPPARKPPAA